MDDNPDYFLDNYGWCLLRRPIPIKPCLCLRSGAWLGRLCEHWRPLGVTSHEELRQHFLRCYAVHGNNQRCTIPVLTQWQNSLITALWCMPLRRITFVKSISV